MFESEYNGCVFLRWHEAQTTVSMDPSLFSNQRLSTVFLFQSVPATLTWLAYPPTCEKRHSRGHSGHRQAGAHQLGSDSDSSSSLPQVLATLPMLTLSMLQFPHKMGEREQNSSQRSRRIKCLNTTYCFLRRGCSFHIRSNLGSGFKSEFKAATSWLQTTTVLTTWTFI